MAGVDAGGTNVTVTQNANDLTIEAWLCDVRNVGAPPIVGKVYRGVVVIIVAVLTLSFRQCFVVFELVIAAAEVNQVDCAVVIVIEAVGAGRRLQGGDHATVSGQCDAADALGQSPALGASAGSTATDLAPLDVNPIERLLRDRPDR